MGRGQTTIELLILIGVSLTALSIVYEIYSDQLDSGGAAKDVMLVRTTLSRLTNSANALHLSGTGSRASVLVELPSTIVMSESIIRGPSIFVKLSNGNTILSSADVNFSGDFKKSEGVYVTGGYYASLYFDGNAVTISYEDYDLSTDTISFSAKQGSLVEKSFSIRNTSPSTAAFWVSSDFSNSPFVTMSIGSDDSSFSLSSGEVRVVDINFLISSSAMGVYSGSINVIGLVSNGTSDSNVSKTIGVSVESFLEIKSVMIYPKSAQVNIPVGDMRQVRFSVCNTSSSDFNGVSWERDSNRDANMLLWFSWEPTDSNGSTISRVKNSDCNIFDLNVTVPFSTPFGNYDSNFTVSLADGNYFTSYLYVTVSSWLYYKILFLSGKSSFDVNALWGSSFFSSTSFAHGVIPTGELDWNSSANYSFNGADYNRDLNGVVGYWKFNEKDASSRVKNFSSGNFDSNLFGNADITNSGLWDSNALVLDGNRDYVSTVFTSQDFNTWGNYSASVWFSTAKSYGGMENHIFGARADVNELPEALSLSVTQSGVLRCVAGSSDKNVSVTGSHKVISGIWHQGVCARNGGVLSLFVDGTLDASASGTIVANNDLNKWLIGSYSINSAAFEDFNGSIDEVKLFNRALSSTDVLLDYNRFLQSKYASRVFDLNSSLTSFLSMKINSGVDYNFNSQISSGEGLFDGNLSGLWHFNDKNSSGYLLNTVTNTRTGILSGDANVNGVGLWDTNAVSFGGSSGSVLLSSDANTFLGDGNLSVSFWFKPLSDGKSCTSPKNCTTLIQSTGSDSNWGITLGNLSTSGGISSADWSSINWTQDGNYRQGLPDNNCYSGQSDINMCGNVLLYHMNESSGNISDYSGNANTGTATGLTYGTAGKIGTALTFGSNKYISVPTNPLLNIRDALTISFWIYLTSSHSNNGVLMKCSTAANCSNDQGSYTVILISSNTIMLRLNGQGNLYDTAATTTIPQNTWTHVAFTYNKVNPKVYLNGVLNNTGNYTEQINDTTGTPLKVGYYYSTSYPFYGSMDELAIYNRALSATEIASIYKRGVVDLNLQIRSCTTSDCSGVNFTGPGGLTTTYYNYANKPISLSDPNQYIQYKAFFSTTDTSAAKGTTPALLDINLVRSDGTITTDTSKADFDLGTDVNTTHTADGNVILLAVSSVYPLTGTFTSKIFDKGAGSTPDGNGYRIFFYNNTSSEQYVSAPYSLGKWSNIVAVRSGGKINLYLNSQLLGSTEDGGSTNLSYPLVIGGTSSTNGGYFNGLIEELALWRKGLSVTEVASLFRKGAVSVDANVYSCSDANCNSITGFLQLSNLRNNSGQSISTLASARYFKYSLGFSYLSRVFDSNSLGSFASAGVPFVSDVNIIYAN